MTKPASRAKKVKVEMSLSYRQLLWRMRRWFRQQTSLNHVQIDKIVDRAEKQISEAATVGKSK